MLVAIWAVGLAWGGEVGTRLEVGDRASGVGWFHLSGEVGSVTLSGRIEGDLLCGCLRRVQLGASAGWDDLSTGVEVSILSTGRVDLSTTGSWKPLWRTDLGLVSAQVGGKATSIDVLGGRFLAAAGWAFGRLDRDPFWIEANGNLSWPGGNPYGDLRWGLTGAAWATFTISSSGASLELGAERPDFLIQSHLSLRPPFQTVTIGLGAERIRVQARMTVRAEGTPSGSLTLTAGDGPWWGSVMAFLATTGLEKVTVEVRYTLGE